MSRSRLHHRSHPRHPVPAIRPDDLYDYYTAEPALRRNAPSTNAPETWRVTDDWPDEVPISEAEIEVFERWFGDFFDELFGPCEKPEGLTKLSSDDKYKP